MTANTNGRIKNMGPGTGCTTRANPKAEPGKPGYVRFAVDEQSEPVRTRPAIPDQGTRASYPGNGIPVSSEKALAVRLSLARA